MRKIPFFIISLLISQAFLFTSCKKKEESDKKVPENFLLRFSDPVAFSFDVLKDSQEVNLGLEIGYFEDKVNLEKSGTALEKLQLYCMLMGDDANLAGDKKFDVKIKEKKGGWLGDKKENGERLVKVSPNPLKPVILKPGRYHFKIYSNATSEENITGISQLVFHKEATPLKKK